MDSLLSQKCVPCEGDVPPLSEEEVRGLLSQVPGWVADSDFKKIERTFKFKDFKQAMEFVNKVAGLAEGEGHHPDIHIHYSRVRLGISRFSFLPQILYYRNTYRSLTNFSCSRKT